MGRIVVPIVVENMDDRDRAERGEMAREDVRRIEVDALVDTGARFLCLPAPLVQQLGLRFDRTRDSLTVTGVIALDVYRTARLEVQGRACSVEVMPLPAGRQALLGQIPLETLDWWIDTANHKLVGNPEHGGEWMAEVF